MKPPLRNPVDGEKRSSPAPLRSAPLHFLPRIMANIHSPRFLLKYVSRDELAVLARGSGGIVELRLEMLKFEEPAPLFGLVRYRRRSVLIKFVPETCSRLVQGQFQHQHPHHTSLGS